jgi:tetratricopeptide (TPR) repeat protein
LLLARAYFKLAQYAKVEQLLVNHGILTDKDKENYYLGDSLIELGRFGEGAEYLKRYVKYHPRDYIAFVRLGYAYFKEELYDLALEAYRQAEILNPQKIEIKDSINLCYEKLKQMKPGE